MISKMQIFNEIMDLQELVFKGDDLMDQEDLFELQDKISDLSLKVAHSFKGKNQNLAVKKLVTKFPYCYEMVKEES